MRSPIGPIRENPQTRAFLHDLMKEAVAVGRAHGVDLPEEGYDLLSDEFIMKALDQQGIKVARRTVAKYREQLNILPSHLRKTF